MHRRRRSVEEVGRDQSLKNGLDHAEGHLVMEKGIVVRAAGGALLRRPRGGNFLALRLGEEMSQNMPLPKMRIWY
jgi:hypothetical protein